MASLTRRGLLLVPLAAAAQTKTRTVVTAGQIVDQIKDKVGIPWREQTVDKIVFGDASTPITGIATTMMATYEVLQRAHKAGCNMVITHEPTFYNHQDSVENFKHDSTYLHKSAWMLKNNMVVFHFHDHWHGMKPDGIATGMARELDWQRFQVAPDKPKVFRMPPATSLDALVKELETKLHAAAVRVVGKPAMAVRNVTASWGYASLNATETLARPDVDVLIVGETREWEVIEYAQDQLAAGRNKALIVLGHVPSEQAGMKYCAEWLKGFVTDVPVQFLASAEPFWPRTR